MRKIRLILAILACKSGILLSKILKKGGSSMPGALAMKICPDILGILSRQVKKEIIAVCGTNGKTTTNNLIYSFLTENGYDVICNNVGANMLPGVCCAFAAKATISGKIKSDFACLEIDEASAVRVFAKMSPHKMIITNLFTDQLDRYGEVEKTAELLKKALNLTPETELIINGDDPNVTHIGTGRKCYYIGIDEETKTNSEIDENSLCPICGEKLSYDFRHYSQLGKYFCENCGYKRPELYFKISDATSSSGLKFNLSVGEKTFPFDINYKGFYNIYNVATSFAAAYLMMGKVENYGNILASYKPQTGRMEEFYIGKKVILNMSKNPAGFNQGIAAVMTDEKPKDVAIMVNDTPADGIDISWLWDVDFERLHNANIRSIIISGTRADDIAVRFKYGDFDEKILKKAPTIKDAYEMIQNGDGEVCYCLANYTSTFKIREILAEKEGGTK